MRRARLPSEIARLAAPLARLLDGAWRRMHWWVAAMAVLYAFSGVTVVRSDEVAVVLRWGRLVGDTPGTQEHGPGLLFALPKPIDEVVRVPVKRVREVTVRTLMADAPRADADTLDPLSGYALTGDQNVVHVEMTARYRVRDPAEWAFYGPNADDVLRVEVTAAMVRSLGEMSVDRVLADGRQDLVTVAMRRAQAGLDAAHSGLELSSLELTRLSPPLVLAADFDAVQSAFIGAETSQKEAQAYAQRAIPEAQASADSAVQMARGEAASQLALARGEAQAFRDLDREYRRNAVVVRERLYRDAVDRAIASASSVRWIPPPVGGSYKGLRITITPDAAGPRFDAGAERFGRDPLSPAPPPKIPEDND